MAKYNVITSHEEFSNLSNTWNELYSKTSNKSVFQSYDWNYQWYYNSHQSDKLFIITVFNQSPKTLDAIFPFIIDKNKTLRFIGDIHSDYSNFLITELESSKLYEVFKLFRKILDDTDEIDSIELKNIVQNNLYLGFLTNQFDFKQIIYNTNGYSSIALQSKEDFWSSFSYLNSKGRNELKRVYKKYEELEGRLFRFQDDPFPKEKIVTLFAEMVQSKERDEDYLNQHFLTIIENMYNAGHLHVFEVHNENQSLAIKLILKDQENHHLFWIDLYKDLPMINIFSYIKYIKNINGEGYTENVIDFGRGLYDYKLKNFQPTIGLQYTFFYSKSNFKFGYYTFKFALKSAIKNFYKNNKVIFNKILRR